MKHPRTLLALALLFPSFAFAQEGIQTIIVAVMGFLNAVFIPFLLGIGFLFFVWNAIRYFVIEGGNEGAREDAKNLALYSVLAFVVIVIFWGVVNMLVNSIGLQDEAAQTPDYLKMKGENWTKPLPPTQEI